MSIALVRLRELVSTGDVTRAGLARMLRRVWVETDRPASLATVEQWLELFDAVGGFTLGSTIREDARPLQPLTLYRAATPEHALGMSWTPYRRTAHAYGWMRGGCYLWSARVTPEAMRAAYSGSPWSTTWDEIVVDPRELQPRRLHLIPRVPPGPDAARDEDDARALVRAWDAS